MTIVTPGTASHADDPTLVARLVDVVNAAYARGEAGMWHPGATRTTPGEIVDLLRSGRLLLAWQDDALVGSVDVVVWDDTTAELGMVAVHPDHHGEGVGIALMEAAEAWGRARRPRMRLEVLTPCAGHPWKQRLHAWYQRRGYAIAGTEPFDDRFGHLAAALAVPCDLVVFERAW